VTYVIAGDQRWIDRSFEIVYESYRELAGESDRRLGALFLLKTFQLSTEVPAMSQQTSSEYWKYLLRIDQSQYEAELQERSKRPRRL
jgi:hypothetical protein